MVRTPAGIPTHGPHPDAQATPAGLRAHTRMSRTHPPTQAHTRTLPHPGNHQGSMYGLPVLAERLLIKRSVLCDSSAPPVQPQGENLFFKVGFHLQRDWAPGPRPASPPRPSPPTESPTVTVTRWLPALRLRLWSLPMEPGFRGAGRTGKTTFHSFSSSNRLCGRSLSCG